MLQPMQGSAEVGKLAERQRFSNYYHLALQCKQPGTEALHDTVDSLRDVLHDLRTPPSLVVHLTTSFSGPGHIEIQLIWRVAGGVEGMLAVAKCRRSCKGPRKAKSTRARVKTDLQGDDVRMMHFTPHLSGHRSCPHRNSLCHQDLPAALDSCTFGRRRPGTVLKACDELIVKTV